MSLIIRLIARKNKIGWSETVKSIDETLIDIGLPATGCALKLPENNVTIPWMRTSVSEFCYFQFIAAKLREEPLWTPSEDFIRQTMSIDTKKRFVADNKSHLICHHALFGYYVPVDFGDIELPPEFLISIGSSINVCEELEKMAQSLKFNLGSYTPDLETLCENRYSELEDDILMREKMLLLCFYNMMLGSIKNKLIVEMSG